MIQALFLASALLAGAAQQDAPSASELISKMIAKYNSAKTLKGTIVLRQGTATESATLTTQIQYEHPAKLYIRQQKDYGDRKVWLVTSDGKHFSYPAPQVIGQDSKRLAEPINLASGKVLGLRDIYSGVVGGIGDRSAPLDIAISRTEDLQYLRGQWYTVRVDGVTKVRDVEAYSISGQWKEYGDADHPSGRFQMLIGKEGDLMRYVIEQTLDLGGQRFNVTSLWEVDLKVNVEVDQKLFKLVL
ncbi:MAG: hypothetical protein HZC36_04280 [Armatimonadetes bacterium]|nr:hypothetical protein [Armatimonadota bacterium]